MLYSTKGIFIHKIKYSESNLIVKVYTEKFGMKSYFFRTNSKKQSTSSNLQHLSLIEITASNRENRDLQYIKSIDSDYNYKSLYYDINKSSVILFLNEILLNSLRHEEYDPGLFHFLRNSLIFYDNCNVSLPDFHLWFCLKLTKFLGFYPGTATNENCFFDMAEGIFTTSLPSHSSYIKKDKTLILMKLINSNIEQLTDIKLPLNTRREFTDIIINYFKLHLQYFGEINSNKVLRELL